MKRLFIKDRAIVVVSDSRRRRRSITIAFDQFLLAYSLPKISKVKIIIITQLANNII